jgi:hypothetical protein
MKFDFHQKKKHRVKTEEYEFILNFQMNDKKIMCGL